MSYMGIESNDKSKNCNKYSIEYFYVKLNVKIDKFIVSRNYCCLLNLNPNKFITIAYFILLSFLLLIHY